MQLLQGLIAIALTTLVGLGLVRVTPTLWAASWPARLAWSYVLGTVLCGFALWAASHWARMPLERGWIVGLVGLLCLVAIACLAGARRLSEAMPLRRRSGPPLLLLGVLAVPFLALVAEAAANPVTDVDGRVTWVAHARYMRAAGTVDAPVFETKSVLVAHPRYPKLMPLHQVAILEAFDSTDERSFRPLYPALWLAWVLIVFDLLELWVGRRPAIAGALAAAVVPLAAFTTDGGAAGTYNDLPLACMFGGGLALLLTRSRDRALGVAAGTLLAGSVLIKNEGALLAGIALLVALVVGPSWRRRRLRLAVPVVALAFLLVASWSAAIPNRLDEAYWSRLDVELVTAGVGTFIQRGLPEMLRQTFAWEHWALFFPVLLLCFALSLRRPSRLHVAILATLGMALGAFVLAYVITPWRDVADLVEVTWARLLLQLSIPLLLLGALPFGEDDAPLREPLLRGRFVGSLIGVLLIAHIAVGGVRMASSSRRFASQLKYLTEDPQTARSRVFGSYAQGLELAETRIGPNDRYLLVRRPEDTSHLLLQGDLAPRWALRPPRPSQAPAGVDRASLPEWTVVHRGDDPPEVLPTAEWVARRDSRVGGEPP